MTEPPMGWPSTLGELPPLMTHEAVEAGEIVLPLRFACAWHGLTWFPVERDGDVLYGLTVRLEPEWRRFRLSELMWRYGPERAPVLIDKSHQPAPAADVPEVARLGLLDLTPFIPSPVPRP